MKRLLRALFLLHLRRLNSHQLRRHQSSQVLPLCNYMLQKAQQ